MEGWMDEWKEEWMDGRMDGWKDGCALRAHLPSGPLDKPPARALCRKHGRGKWGRAAGVHTSARESPACDAAPGIPTPHLPRALVTPPPPLQWLLLREPQAWPSWLLRASPRGAPGPRQLSVQLAMPGAPPCRPAQPHLCPIEASSMDSAIPAGQPQLHVKFLPAFLGWGEGFGLPKRGHLCQHADSWGWRIPEAVPRARPAFPVAWRAPRPAVTHPAQQESGRNVPCALPWIPGPPAPSGRLIDTSCRVLSSCRERKLRSGSS